MKNRKRVLIVDDEKWCLKGAARICRAVMENAEITECMSYDEAFSYAMNNTIDIALVDVIMPQLSGIVLGQLLKKLNRDMLLVYMSSDERYAGHAEESMGDYFILKPLDENHLRKILFTFETPVL